MTPPRNGVFQGSRPALIAAFLIMLIRSSVGADDAYERGRSSGRVLVTLRAPWACAIAILNDRCKRDVAIFFKDTTDAQLQSIPKIGPHPLTGLQSFVNDGAREALDRELSYIGAVAAPPDQWKRDPGAAALFDAASETIVWPAAMDNLAAQYLSLGAMLDLLKHRDQIPAGTLPSEISLPAPKSSADDSVPPNIRELTSAFVAQIDRQRPPQSLLVLTTVSGTRGDALIGVAHSTLAELIDNPPWLAQTDSQIFAQELLAGKADDPPEILSANQQCRKTLNVDATFDHSKAIRACESSSIAHIRSLPVKRRRAFLLGVVAAQATYNAAVLRSETAATNFLRLLSTFDDLDGVLPAFAAARSHANGVSAKDWKSQFSLGLQLVHAVQNG